MTRTITYQIETTAIESGQKNILGFLKSRGYSHAVLTHLKRTPEGILLNGVWARVYDAISAGDTLTVHICEDSGSENIVPTPLPLDIVYEDEDLLIINKPAGMPIHPSQGNYDNTLANALAWYFQQQSVSFTYRCINRLDRDTSGLLIVAKHMLSACILSAMVARRDIHREYLAAATGLVPESGTINAPISRKDGSTIERQVDRIHGETACTHFRRLAYGEGYSLLALTLDTGRTHQIRVHMNFIGHPLPGDFLYNPDYERISRQALHSWKLEFHHPISGKSLCFTAPLPDDIRQIWTDLDFS